MSKEVSVGNRYKFASPSLLGNRPIVEVLEFNQQDKQVRYRYAGKPVFEMTLKVDSFLAIYEERVS